MSQTSRFEPQLLGFLCNWCCYAGADLAGVSRYQYPPNMRVIRVPCSGRVDPAFVLRAFSNGIDGVFIGGCWLGECHYLTQGNYHALSVMHLCKKLLQRIGVSPERLRLEWVSASQGIRFAELVTDFTDQLKRLGPLGIDRGKDGSRLAMKLEAAQSLVPYIKLAEREKLRVRFNTEEEYERFFASPEVEGIFDELVADRLAMVQIVLLLRERPLSRGEISGRLGMEVSKVSRHIRDLTRKGLVRCDEGQQRFVPVELEVVTGGRQRGYEISGDG